MIAAITEVSWRDCCNYKPTTNLVIKCEWWKASKGSKNCQKFQEEILAFQAKTFAESTIKHEMMLCCIKTSCYSTCISIVDKQLWCINNWELTTNKVNVVDGKYSTLPTQHSTFLFHTLQLFNTLQHRLQLTVLLSVLIKSIIVIKYFTARDLMLHHYQYFYSISVLKYVSNFFVDWRWLWSFCRWGRIWGIEIKSVCINLDHHGVCLLP